MDEGEICGDIEDIIKEIHLYRTQYKSCIVPNVSMNFHHETGSQYKKHLLGSIEYC